MQEVYDAHHKKFNVLDLGKRGGHTDYIDFIEESEVPYKAMVGIDKFKREFIVLKCIVTRQNGKQLNCFQTFFKRYTDDQKIWVGAGDLNNQLFRTDGGMNSRQVSLLNDLLQNESIEIKINGKLLEDIRFSFIKFYDDPNENPPVKIELSVW